MTCTVLPALSQSCRAHLQMEGLEAPALLRGIANRPALWSLWHWSLGSSRLTVADFRFCPVTPASEHCSPGWLPSSLQLHFLHSSPVHSSQQQHCCPALSCLRRGQGSKHIGVGSIPGVGAGTNQVSLFLLWPLPHLLAPCRPLCPHEEHLQQPQRDHEPA